MVYFLGRDLVYEHRKLGDLDNADLSTRGTDPGPKLESGRGVSQDSNHVVPDEHEKRESGDHFLYTPSYYLIKLSIDTIYMCLLAS
jgi:hypothetical protein